MVEFGVLSGPIARVISLYNRLEPGQNVLADADFLSLGDTLDRLLQDDWNVFSDKLVDSGNAGLLLASIANFHWDDESGEPPVDAYELYTREKSLWHSSLAEKWSDFCSDVRTDALTPLDLGVPLDEDLDRCATEVEAETIYWRARIGFVECDPKAPKRYSGQ